MSIAAIERMCTQSPQEKRKFRGACAVCGSYELQWDWHGRRLECLSCHASGEGRAALALLSVTDVTETRLGGDNMPKKICTAEGCTRQISQEGLCYKHYKARFGHPPGRKWREKQKQATQVETTFMTDAGAAAARAEVSPEKKPVARPLPAPLKRALAALPIPDHNGSIAQDAAIILPDAVAARFDRITIILERQHG